MILCFLFAALIVALDQFFKQWIVRTVALGEIGPDIIPGVLGLTHWQNDGAMLNILSGQQWLLAGIAFVAAVVLIMILLRYNEGFWGTLALAAVLGGTVGNLIDRIFNSGKVIDMFRTLFIDFPIFNIADIFITLGFITFLIHFIVLTFKSGSPDTPAAVIPGRAQEEPGMADSSQSMSLSDIASRSPAPTLPQTQAYTQETPAYVQPAPVYTQQTPVYTQETPVYTQETPVYTQETSVYSQEPAVPVAPTAGYTPAPPVQPASNDYSAPPAESYDYDASTDTTPEISLTLEALEAELGSLDVDYDVDDLLREYGIEDNDSNQ